MASGLLLRANGKYELVDVPRGKKAMDVIQKHVGGYYEMLAGKAMGPVVWIDEAGKKWPLCGYANEEGIMKALPQNGWSAVLDLIGFAVPWSFGGYCGDLLLLGEDAESNKARHLPQCIQTLFEEVKKIDDDEDGDIDAFLVQLEQTVKSRKRGEQVLKKEVRKKSAEFEPPVSRGSTMATKSAKSAMSAKSAKSAKSEPPVSGGSTMSAKSAKSAKSARSAKSAKSAKPTKVDNTPKKRMPEPEEMALLPIKKRMKNTETSETVK
jgi:hypothetical protein